MKAKEPGYLLLALLLVAMLLTQTHGLITNQEFAATERGRGAVARLASARVTPPALVQYAVQYGKLPLSFEANQGQSDGCVRFLSRGSGYTIFLTPGELALVLQTSTPQGRHELNADLAAVQARDMTQRTAVAALHMKLVGANPAPRIAGQEELPGKTNYFNGNDPRKWRTNVPTYARVSYQGIYPGVDLVYYGNQRQLEHDFVVKPGADPKAITLGFRGADNLTLDDHGDLLIQTRGEQMILQAPVIYQESRGVKQGIEGRYVLKGKRQVGFELADYDAGKPLIIDPVLVYSTYLGGSRLDSGNGIAVDKHGNAYVIGETTSTDFPTTGTPKQGASVEHAFVSKLNEDGSALVYTTFLGGSSVDLGSGVAVDEHGDAYVTGQTGSTDFPLANPFQGTYGGNGDAFVSKLNEDGSALVYSTYLGGSDLDQSFGIAVDKHGNAYVTGFTLSTNFPMANSFQGTLGGVQNAFVSKLKEDGSALVYSTYLGGSASDRGSGIAVNKDGNAYVTGDTSSTNFPMANPSQNTFGRGVSDAFVSKLKEDGSALVYSTYLGGGQLNEGNGIAVDERGDAYITGETTSANFPTANPFQGTFGGLLDGFVAKISVESR